jgi:hypothetical protein
MLAGFQTLTNFSKDTSNYAKNMDPEQLQKSILNVIKKGVSISSFLDLTREESEHQKLLRHPNLEHQGPSGGRVSYRGWAQIGLEADK